MAGFSQGGAVAIQVALTYPQRLAGLLGLSTYFASKDSLQADPANARLPIRLYHGNLDPMVPESIGRTSYEALVKRGYEVAYKTYPMGHSVCLEEVRDIGMWMREILSLE